MNVAGKKLVVTGVIAGESRATAETKLREAGAKVQSAVGRDTEMLVTGDRVGPKKIEKAKALGIAIVPWDEVWGERRGGAGGAVPRPKTLKASEVREIGAMLARPADDVPGAPGWCYEVKWDGYRAITTVKGGAVVMQSRSGKSDYIARFPHIAAELAELPDCVIDGELVVLDDKGVSNFQNLTGHANGGRAKYVVFDVLEVKGRDVRREPLHVRQMMIEDLLVNIDQSQVAASPVFEDGEHLLQKAVELEWEGIVAKRLMSTYQEAKRSPDWLKIKVRGQQEFIVLGYTAGEGNRKGTAGALVLGYYDDDGGLVWAGNAGTGGTYDDFKAIVDATKKPRVKDPVSKIDFGDEPMRKFKTTTWVQPTVVVEVRFQRWTEDGRLWHPSIQGMRHDKPATHVIREAVGG